SLGCRMMLHPVISPIRLLPREVTGPAQSWLVSPAFRASIVFTRRVVAFVPLKRAEPPTAGLSAIVLFKRISVAKLAIATPRLELVSIMLRANVVFVMIAVPRKFCKPPPAVNSGVGPTALFSINALSETTSVLLSARTPLIGRPALWSNVEFVIDTVAPTVQR